MLITKNEIIVNFENVLNYYTPDVEIHDEAPPPVSMELIKRNVIDYVAEETGVDKVMNAVSDPTKALETAATAAVGNAVQGATNKVKAAVGSSVGGKRRAKGGNRTIHKKRNALLFTRKYR